MLFSDLIDYLKNEKTFNIILMKMSILNATLF